MRPDRGILRLWAGLAGGLLWTPAIAVPGIQVPLQPLDILVLAGLPLFVVWVPRFAQSAGWVGITFIGSVLLSFGVAGGNGLVLAHALVLALGFMGLVCALAQSEPARRALVLGFLMGAFGSAVLFAAQIALGAERLDFRSNIAFSLPAQYGRGFALMPEVSTFATHAALALAMCVGIVLHPLGGQVVRRGLALGLAALLCAALMLTRSTSFLLVAPVLCLLAVTQARRLDVATLVRLALGLALASGVLAVFFLNFYADRLETASATRSASMRLASVLGGLSPLWSGEVFGVGLGENHEIQRRAFDMGRLFGLNFGQLPQGVNSQIVARIFEEGWPAVLNIALGLGLLSRLLLQRHRDPVVTALAILAAGSFLTALLVTGYRGIYTNWLWLALPAGVMLREKTGRRRAPFPALHGHP